VVEIKEDYKYFILNSVTCAFLCATYMELHVLVLANFYEFDPMLWHAQLFYVYINDLIYISSFPIPSTVS
jgi:hypothetical protein